MSVARPPTAVQMTAFDREHRAGIEKRDDADPGGIHRAGRRRHEGGDAEHEDAVVGDVVAHEFGTHVVVADGLQHGADPRMGQTPGNEEEDDRHRQDEPQERGADVVRIVGDAVEAAGIGLIFDDELLEDQ